MKAFNYIILYDIRNLYDALVLVDLTFSQKGRAYYTVVVFSPFVQACRVACHGCFLSPQMVSITEEWGPYSILRG